MPLPLMPVILGGVSLTTGAFGVKKGVDAYFDRKKAQKFDTDARSIFEESQEKLNEARELTNSAIVAFGECKKEIFDRYLLEFLDTFSKIKNYEFEESVDLDSKIDITSEELEELKSQILDMQTAFGGVVALGAGAAA